MSSLQMRDNNSVLLFGLLSEGEAPDLSLFNVSLETIFQNLIKTDKSQEYEIFTSLRGFEWPVKN